MRFVFPNFPSEFEIPDDWLAEAGLIGFVPTSQAYLSTDDAELVPLREIEPPYRRTSVGKDWRGFDRSRLVNVLKEIVSGKVIWPVPLHTLHNNFSSMVPYRYCVAGGYHRFHSAIIAGYTYLPAVID